MYFAPPTADSYAHRMLHKKADRFAAHPKTVGQMDQRLKHQRALAVLTADPSAGAAYLDILTLRQLFGNVAVSDIKLTANGSGISSGGAYTTPQRVNSTHLATIIAALAQQKVFASEACRRIALRNSVVDAIRRETCAIFFTRPLCESTAAEEAPADASPARKGQPSCRCSDATHIRLAQLLRQLDAATEAVVSAVLRWRLNLTHPMPFLFNGSNYLLRIEHEQTALVAKCEVHLMEAAGGRAAFSKDGCRYFFSSLYSGMPQLYAVGASFKVRKRSVVVGRASVGLSRRSSSVKQLTGLGARGGTPLSAEQARAQRDITDPGDELYDDVAPVTAMRLAARRYAVHSAIVCEREVQEAVLAAGLDATNLAMDALQSHHASRPQQPSGASSSYDNGQPHPNHHNTSSSGSDVVASVPVHPLALAQTVVLFDSHHPAAASTGTVPSRLVEEHEMDPFTETAVAVDGLLGPTHHRSIRQAVLTHFTRRNSPQRRASQATLDASLAKQQLRLAEWCSPHGYTASIRNAAVLIPAAKPPGRSRSPATVEAHPVRQVASAPPGTAALAEGSASAPRQPRGGATGLTVPAVYSVTGIQHSGGARGARLPKRLPPIDDSGVVVVTASAARGKTGHVATSTYDTSADTSHAFQTVVLIDGNGWLTVNGLAYLLTSVSSPILATAEARPTTVAERRQQLVAQTLEWNKRCYVLAQTILEEPFDSVVGPIVTGHQAVDWPADDDAEDGPAPADEPPSTAAGNGAAAGGPSFGARAMSIVVEADEAAILSTAGTRRSHGSKRVSILAPSGSSVGLTGQGGLMRPNKPRRSSSTAQRKSIVDDASLDSVIALLFGPDWSTPASAAAGSTSGASQAKLVSLIRRTVRRLLLRKLTQWTKHVSLRMRRRSKACELEKANKRVLAAERYALWLYRVELLKERRRLAVEILHATQVALLRLRFQSLKGYALVQRTRKVLSRRMFQRVDSTHARAVLGGSRRGE